MCYKRVKIAHRNTEGFIKVQLFIINCKVQIQNLQSVMNYFVKQSSMNSLLKATEQKNIFVHSDFGIYFGIRI